MKKYENYVNNVYQFDDYYCVPVSCEVIDFYYKDGNYLGCMVTDNMQSCINDLEHGVDPINNSWENGAGTTLILDGWD